MQTIERSRDLRAAISTSVMKANLLIALLLLAVAFTASGGRADTGLPGAGCPHADLVFYSTDSNRLAQRLHANQSACADFYISTTPAGDLISPRSNIAPLIRANGPQFHAMPEFRPDEWAKWLADPANAGKTWFDAGVEFRRRMVTAGFDVAKGDTWVVNDVGWPTRSATGLAVFNGTGTARADLLDLVRGLYTGDPGMPPAPGAVFGAGPVQETTDLDQYRQGLDAWYGDSAFWQGLSGYVRFWAQDTWADARAWGVPGSTLAQRSAYLDDYFTHPSRVALAGGESTEAAAAFLAGAYTPLGNASFRWGAPSPPGPGFGYTDVGLMGMQSFVASQAYALRSASPERFGFGVVPNGSTPTDTIAIEDEVAASIHSSEADVGGACATIPGCDADVDGAQFVDAWKTFANTLEGSQVQVAIPRSLTVTFATVDARGATGVATGPLVGPAPARTQIRPGARFYTLRTNATYHGPVDVCAAYDAQTYAGYAPRLFELAGDDWNDVTTTSGASDVCGTASALGTFAIFAVDATPPVLTVPAGVAVDATGATGARAVFAATALDAVDPAPTVVCAPASGTQFAIGDTVVTCTAADASGNSTATSFVVHVRGASEQLALLAVAVDGVGPGQSLADKVDDASAALAGGDVVAAVSILRALEREVAAQSGKRLTFDAVAALAGTAARIAAVLEG
jgi:hypothetical protein